MYSSGRSSRIVDTDIVFSGRTTVFMPLFYRSTDQPVFKCLKKNQNAPRPSEHPPVMGEKCQNV